MNGLPVTLHLAELIYRPMKAVFVSRFVPVEVVQLSQRGYNSVREVTRGKRG